MSRIRADRIVDRAATGAPLFPNGAVVTGVTTATTFSGALSGNATSATTATTATNAQGLTGTPSIVVGSVTGTTGSFSGNVSVGGTLTYEDVTNVDSVGIVTAQTGVRVNAGGVVVSAGGLNLTGPYKENITAVSALQIDCSQGNYFTKTINGNSTFTFANVPTGCAYAFTLELTHTNGTVAWPDGSGGQGTVKFPANTPPTLTTGKTHLFMFITDDGGTTFRGSTLVDYEN